MRYSSIFFDFLKFLITPQYDTARVILIRAQEIMAEGHHLITSQLRATTLNNLGTVCSKQNKHEESLGFALSAVAAARQIEITPIQRRTNEEDLTDDNSGNSNIEENGTTKEDKARCLALALHNLGVEQECLGDYEAAKITFNHSKDIVRKALDDSTGVDILASVSRVPRGRGGRGGSRPTSPQNRNMNSNSSDVGGIVLRPPSLGRQPTYGRVLSSPTSSSLTSTSQLGTAQLGTAQISSFSNLQQDYKSDAQQIVGLNNLEKRLHRQMLGRRVVLKTDSTMNQDTDKYTSVTRSMDSHHLEMDL